MAANVNKKVVVILIVSVIGAVGLVMVAMNVVLKSGKEHAANGDRLMAEGKYEEAATAYSKAVNKDQNNTDYYVKWGDAIRKQNPVSIQAYTDRYRQWLSTQRQIANIKRVDPAAHRVVMDLVLRDARISPRSAPAWQSLESDSSDVITRMRNEPQDKIDQIRRYRGIATTGKMIQSLDVSADDRKRAKEDLLTAMKQNPDDSLAAMYYADLMRLTADKLHQSNNAEEAATTLAEGLAVMNDFCAKHPTSTVARLGVYNLELSGLAAQVRAGTIGNDEIIAQLKPKVEGLLMTLESEDPKIVDEFVATQVLETAVGNKAENAVPRGVAVFDKIVASRQGEPFSLLMRARFRAMTGSPREAVNEFKAIMDLPNLPVSPLGISLFGVRDSAAIQRVEALVGLTQAAKNPSPERAAALAETQAARDELRARSTIDEAPKLLIDAKVALLSNQGADARRLLDQYHKATNNTDAAAMFLSFQVLRQQGLKGEARTMLTRIVEMRRATPEVYKQLALIDYELQNFPSSLNWIEQAIAMAPTDDNALKIREEILKRVNTTPSDKPLERLINEAQTALMQTPPNIELARAKANEALSHCVTAQDFAGVAQLLGRTSRLDGLSAVNRGLEKYPGDKVLTMMKQSYEVENPIEETEKRINADPTLSAIDKAVQKYMLYSQVGNNEKAATFLSEATALDPEHSVVVAAQFEKALSERDADGKVPPPAIEKARALAQKAKERNLDKVEGRIYAARLAEAERKFDEAVPLLERATEIDALNPLTWRYLSNAYLNVGEMVKALQAVQRSLQIKPDDVPAIVSRVRILAAMDRMTEALAAARDASRLGISDPMFVHFWLLLEFRTGDKDVALERRAWIMDQQPDNLENALEYARCLMQVRRLEDARATLDKVGVKVAEKPSVGAEQSLKMLRAALRGAQGDVAGTLAEFEKLMANVQEERREVATVEFAELVKTLGGSDLVVQVLEKGRQYQNPQTARIDRMLGDMHFGMGNWEKARAAYARARDTVPEDPDKLLLKRIIECSMKDKNFDEARKLIDAEGGDKSKDVQILLLSSQLEFARGDRAKGMALLDKAVEAAPDKALPYRQRGIERMADPKTIDDAIVDFEQASGIEARNADLTVLLSRAYTRKGDPGRAVEVIEKALNTQPDNGLLHNERIQQYMAAQRYDDAIKACDDAIKVEPNNTRWLLLKGIVYQRKGDQLAAAGVFEEAWKIRRSFDTGKALADALMAAYDSSNPRNPALLDRARVVLEDPGAGTDAEPMVRMSVVTLNLRQNRRDDAVAGLRSVMADKKFRINDTQLAVFLLDELRRGFGGDLKKVLELLDEVRPAEGWPDIFKLSIARAQLSVPEMKLKAMDDLEVLMKSPDRSTALGASSTLGANAYLLPDIDRSIRALQNGLAMDPDNVELNNNLAYVLSQGSKRHGDALSFALKASEKDPNNPNILDTVGVIHLHLNEYEKAEDMLTRARSVANDGLTRVMPTIHLIQVKLKKKLRSEADALYRELIELQKTDPRIKSNYGKDIEAIEKEMQANP